MIDRQLEENSCIFTGLCFQCFTVCNNNNRRRKPATNVTLHSFKNCTQELDAVTLQTLSGCNMKMHIQEK